MQRSGVVSALTEGVPVPASPVGGTSVGTASMSSSLTTVASASERASHRWQPHPSLLMERAEDDDDGEGLIRPAPKLLTPDRIKNYARMRLLQARSNWRSTAFAVAAVALLALTAKRGSEGRGLVYDPQTGGPTEDGVSVGGGDRAFDPDSFPRRSGAVDRFSAAALTLPGMSHGLEPQQLRTGGTALSRHLEFLVDVDEPRMEGDVPLFFHIPRSGGSTIKDILGMCLNLVAASDVGARNHRGIVPNLGKVSLIAALALAVAVVQALGRPLSLSSRHSRGDRPRQKISPTLCLPSCPDRVWRF